MKKRLEIPHHLFTYEDMRFAFDVTNVKFMRIGEVAYHVLSQKRNGLSDEQIPALLSDQFPSEEITTTIEELKYVQTKRLLNLPTRTWDDEEKASRVKELVNRRTNKVTLALAEACNLRCKYCYVGANEALDHGLMPEKIAKQAVDFVFKRAGRSKSISILFFGGEPLLNMPVLRFVVGYSQRLGKRRGKKVRYSITANGTLIDEEVIRYIKKYNFGLMISMDGPKEVQDENRPLACGGSSFDMMAPKLKRLMERRRRVTVRCTVSKPYLEKRKLVEFFEDFGFTRVAMSPAVGKSHRRDEYDVDHESLKALDAEDQAIIRDVFEKLKAGDPVRYNPCSKIIPRIHSSAPLTIGCGVGRGTTTVGIDGRLYPCHRYTGMENHVLGDVWSGVDKDRFANYLRCYFDLKKKCIRSSRRGGSSCACGRCSTRRTRTEFMPGSWRSKQSAKPSTRPTRRASTR